MLKMKKNGMIDLQSAV